MISIENRRRMRGAGEAAATTDEKARPVVATPNLPVTVPLKPARNSRRLRFSVGLLAVLLAAGGGGIYWWKHSQSQLPAGISFGNGRLEADEIDIDTKFPGRIAELRAEIGDMVTAGQVVARMDTRDLQESLKKSASASRAGAANDRRSQRQSGAAAHAADAGGAGAGTDRGPAEERLGDKGTVRSTQTSPRWRKRGVERRDQQGCSS